jgi:hypothetical protein
MGKLINNLEDEHINGIERLGTSQALAELTVT